MSTNGHVTDLGELMDRTRPTRMIRIPLARIRPDELTPYELSLLGRTLMLTPGELTIANVDVWTSLAFIQGFAWVVARREEPNVTWEEAQRWQVEAYALPPDPTPAAEKKSRRPGMKSSSAGSVSPVSDPVSSAG